MGNVGEPLFDPAALRENPSHFQRRSRTVGEKLQALLTEDNVGTSIFERQGKVATKTLIERDRYKNHGGTIKMRAAVTRARKAPALLEELRLEDPRPNEILVRIVASGVCHGDIVARDQVYPVPQPIVLGHEGAGVVEAVGTAVITLRKGDHVILSYDSCGVCESCRDRHPMYRREVFQRNFSGQRPDGTTALSNGTEKIHSHFFGQSSFATWSLATKENAIKERAL
jgi:hypothetical protein